MCGRFYLYADRELIESSFNVDLNLLEIQPRYNITPNQPILTITHDQGGRHAQLMRWGLIPAWSKSIDSRYSMINARAESIHEKPEYRGPFKRTRCLIPASGYYEWKKEKDNKQPFSIARKDGDLLAFAGIWDSWSGPSESIHSCAIVTSNANQQLSKIHERMPVMIETRYFDQWLDPENNNEEALRELFDPSQSPVLKFWPVSKAVNSPKNNNAELN